MIEFRPPASVERPPPRPFQLALRALAIAAAVAAVGFARWAPGSPFLALEVAVGVLAAWCAVVPDSHVGLLVVLLVGVNWLVAVDEPTTAWALGAAAATAVFHTAVGAASVSPAAAGWTPAMRWRWGRWGLGLMAVGLPGWLIVAAVGRVEIGGSGIVFAGALVAIAISGLWADHGIVRGGDRPGV